MRVCVWRGFFCVDLVQKPLTPSVIVKFFKEINTFALHIKRTDLYLLGTSIASFWVPNKRKRNLFPLQPPNHIAPHHHQRIKWRFSHKVRLNLILCLRCGVVRAILCVNVRARRKIFRLKHYNERDKLSVNVK